MICINLIPHDHWLEKVDNSDAEIAGFMACSVKKPKQMDPTCVTILLPLHYFGGLSGNRILYTHDLYKFNFPMTTG